MAAGRVIELGQERHERGAADETRHAHADEYSRILGDDWEPMGDGTYRFVGRQSSAPPLRWEDAPITAADERPAGRQAEPVEEQVAASAKRRWRRL